jgi:hypothetical protein
MTRLQAIVLAAFVLGAWSAGGGRKGFALRNRADAATSAPSKGTRP